MEKEIVFRGGKRVVLRPINEEDVPTLVRWMNNPKVTQYLMRCLPVSLQEEKEWIESLAKRNETDVVLAIVVESKLIGITALHRINHLHQSADTGSVIGEESFWGKGFGTEAKMLMLDFAFNSLNLRKIKSGVIVYNKRSHRYLIKCGYKEEGIKRRELYKDGQFHDEIMLAVFKEEWLPLWEEYKVNFLS